MRAHVEGKDVGGYQGHTDTSTAKLFVTSQPLKARRNFSYEQNLWKFSRRSGFSLSFTSRLGEMENLACAQNIFMVWLGGGKCMMRVIAILEEAISLEGQVCSKIDFSGDEGSYYLGLLKTSVVKNFGKNIADTRFESLGLYHSRDVCYP